MVFQFLDHRSCKIKVVHRKKVPMIAQLDKTYIKINPRKVIPRLVSYAFFEGRPLTTKGTWINPIVFANLEILKQIPFKKKVEKPIFIIGTGRSGTTILGVLLSMHSDVGFLNEPKALWHSVYKEEDVIGSYSRQNAKYRLFEKDATEEVIRNTNRIIGMYLKIIRSKRLVDKYPELIFRIPFVKSIYPDAKLIFLTRNGWDACGSIEKWSKKYKQHVGRELHDWWGADNRKWKLMLSELLNTDPFFQNSIDIISNFTSHNDMAVIEWIVTMREGLKHINNFKNCMYMLRYEDLIENPFKNISQLMAFCELKEDPNVYNYAERVLKKRPQHNKFEIQPQILPLFNETMTSLGYKNL